MGGFSTVGGINLKSIWEYPTRTLTSITRDVFAVDESNLLWTFLTGKATLGCTYWRGMAVLFPSAYPDKAVRSFAMEYAGQNYASYSGLLGRYVSMTTYYGVGIHSSGTSSDLMLYKLVGGSLWSLGYEAVDLRADYLYLLKLSCSGSTINVYREDMTTPKISATDTSIASGMFGLGAAPQNYGYYATYLLHIMNSAGLEAPASPQPRVLAYLEVPVDGSGTAEDPFRARTPQLIDWEWSLNPIAKRKYDALKAKGAADEEIPLEAPEVAVCRVNRLALTHSSLIKTDRSTGKPAEYVAIVRVFEQPDRSAYLYPIDRALEAFKAMPGVRVLARDEAVRRAKQIDPDLTDADLLPIKATDPNFKQILRDYIAHREGLGVKRELIDDKLVERYLQEDKGW